MICKVEVVDEVVPLLLLLLEYVGLCNLCCCNIVGLSLVILALLLPLPLFSDIVEFDLVGRRYIEGGIGDWNWSIVTLSCSC